MLNKYPIILASGSKARYEMLSNAGVTFEKYPADIDEDALINDFVLRKTYHNDVAIKLSEAKALSVSGHYKDHYIIGSDQLLIFKDKIFSKSETIEEAKERLKQFSGQTHSLISAVSVVLNGEIQWSFADHVDLKMHELPEDEIDYYIDNNQDIALSCVGGYAIEESGISLFEEIQGDFFTIMGMPLLPLLNFLRSQGAL